MKKEKKVISDSLHQSLILVFIAIVIVFLAVKIVFM